MCDIPTAFWISAWQRIAGVPHWGAFSSFVSLVFGHVSSHLSAHHHPGSSTLHWHRYEFRKVFLWIPQEGERQTVENQSEDRRNPGQRWRRRPLSSCIIFGIRARYRRRGIAQRRLQNRWREGRSTIRRFTAHFKVTSGDRTRPGRE